MLRPSLFFIYITKVYNIYVDMSIWSYLHRTNVANANLLFPPIPKISSMIEKGRLKVSRLLAYSHNFGRKLSQVIYFFYSNYWRVTKISSD